MLEPSLEFLIKVTAHNLALQLLSKEGPEGVVFKGRRYSGVEN